MKRPETGDTERRESERKKMRTRGKEPVTEKISAEDYEDDEEEEEDVNEEEAEEEKRATSIKKNLEELLNSRKVWQLPDKSKLQYCSFH